MGGEVGGEIATTAVQGGDTQSGKTAKPTKKTGEYSRCIFIACSNHNYIWLIYSFNMVNIIQVYLMSVKKIHQD